MKFLHVLDGNDEVGFEVELVEVGQHFEVFHLGDLVVGEVDNAKGVQQTEAFHLLEAVGMEV